MIDPHPNPKEALTGLRYDDGKPSVGLIPPEFVLALGTHFGKGAKKYAPNNWRKGMAWHICYEAAQRHLLAFWSGEDTDPETGSSHLISAAWNCCALFWYQLRGIGKDDRWTSPQRAQQWADAQAAENHTLPAGSDIDFDSMFPPPRHVFPGSCINEELEKKADSITRAGPGPYRGGQ